MSVLTWVCINCWAVHIPHCLVESAHSWAVFNSSFILEYFWVTLTFWTNYYFSVISVFPFSLLAVTCFRNSSHLPGRQMAENSQLIPFHHHTQTARRVSFRFFNHILDRILLKTDRSLATQIYLTQWKCFTVFSRMVSGFPLLDQTNLPLNLHIKCWWILNISWSCCPRPVPF